jgi:hypothetical protein
MVARMLRPSAKWLLAVPPLLFGLAYVDRIESGQVGDWRTASRGSAGLAPDPAEAREPIVQVYAARTVRWRGYLGVHTWVAVKARDASEFTIYEVNGWRLRRNGTAVMVTSRAPDSRWFGALPERIADLRGDEAEPLIARIEQAAARYPWADTYRVWPGPNSNTFTAFVLREVPELRADLPPTAIGKDYLGASLFATTPSGTGAQVSLFGLLGVLVGLEEGVEVNVLGLTFGVDPRPLSLKLPLAGSLGFGGA